MRNAFARALARLAQRDERIVLLTADLGFMVFEEFAAAFPGRFFNVGVAEADMVGLGTGLALSGYTPFLYSIAPFAVLRPYEHFRNGPVHHALPVRLVGVGGGFDYGHAGGTHWALEDVALMRVQPGIAVAAPADAAQTTSAVEAIQALTGPAYLRLEKGSHRDVPGLGGRFEIGRAHVVREGGDVTIFALGGLVETAWETADSLAGDGVNAELVVVSSLAPAPVKDIVAGLSRHRLAVSVEAHHPSGGLGSMVAEIAAESGWGGRLVRCCVPTAHVERTGSRDYLLKAHGLDAASLRRRVLEAMGRSVS